MKNKLREIKTCRVFLRTVLFLLLMLPVVACINDKALELINCSIDSGACLGYADEGRLKVTFEVTPRPVRSMKRLLFSVRLQEKDKAVTDAEVRAELLMPGMTMAQNSLRLRHTGDGMYSSEGVIVRCSTGKKIWQAVISVSRGSGTTTSTYKTTFIFMTDR